MGSIVGGIRAARAQLRAARDHVLDLRSNYDAAVATFRWPEIDRFNWAVDWFDQELAQSPSAQRTALRIGGGAAATCTFAELKKNA
jgi:acetyl-CoA synthetase